MPAVRIDWTVEMLDDLPDDGSRYDLIDGELFATPAPSDVHQLVIGELQSRLRAYLRPFGIARAIRSPADVRRDDHTRNRVQPDIFVVRLNDGRRPPYPFDLTDLLLAVEVESPSNSAYDYQIKRRLYLTSGIPEYWLVSPESRTIARWRGPRDDADLLTTRLEWHLAGMPDALLISIPEFFDEALG